MTISINKKLISKMIRFSLYHKAFYCYLGMSVWIFFLVTAMYRYMANDEDVNPLKTELKTVEMPKGDKKYQKIYSQVCNPPETIVRGSEGIVDSNTWYLQGALTVLRHGDRGPLTHLRNGDKIPCDSIPDASTLKSYEDFVANGSSTGRAWWVSNAGPFHNFPSLPAKSESTHCALGQLTPRGLLQMIAVGNIFREAYAEKLGLDKIDQHTRKHEAEFITYSTRYRRTYTSVAGFWWGFVRQNAGIRLATVREAHSVMFCFRDCACPAINKLNLKISAKGKKRLEARPGIKELIIQMSKVLFESQEHIDPSVVRDAILAYMCHDVPLPCTYGKDKQNERIARKQNVQRRNRNLLEVDIDTLNMELDYINNKANFNNEVGRKERDLDREDYKQKQPLDFDAQMEKEKLQYYQQKLLDNFEGYDDVVIVKHNLDADFNFPNDAKVDDFEDYKEPTAESLHDLCVTEDQIVSLYGFIYESYKRQIKNIYVKQRATLMAYGLIRHIVHNMIKMISDNKPKFVVYSGHDKTMHALCLALGLYDYEHFNIHYASRLVFEVYRKRELLDEFKFTKRKAVAKDFYFRVVFNGVDVTNTLSFCKNREVVTMQVADPSDDTKVHNTYLCSIENIVRFIHDDYFAIFNVSNFKDACANSGTMN